MRSLLAAAVFLWSASAHSHDYYRDFYSGGAPGLGRWCCSGNLEGTMGDCSPALEWKDNADGSMFVRPAQYPDKWILVAAHRILPVGPQDPEAKAFPVHWCGKPRSAASLPDNDDPDPAFVTICASRYPGGS